MFFKIIIFLASEMYFSAKNLWLFLRNSYKRHGVLSLWRGHTATLMRIFPYAAVQYSLHDRAKHFFGIDKQDLSLMDRNSVRIRRFVSGCCAGTSSVAATYPLDLARARMAITERLQYRNLVHALVKARRDEGFASLYRGFSPAILGSVPYSGVAFFMFETLKEWRLNLRTPVEGSPQQTLRPLENLFCGATAGIMGQTASYPLDIVRRRMQTAVIRGHPEYTEGILKTMRLVYRSEGLFHGLYKGVTMNWVKGPIASGIGFTVFHQIHSLIKRYNLRLDVRRS